MLRYRLTARGNYRCYGHPSPSVNLPLMSLCNLNVNLMQYRSLSQSKDRKFKWKYDVKRQPVLPSALVTHDYVMQNLKRIKLLDASWLMPAEKRNCYQEYLQCRLPGANFFDLDLISDHSTTLPHMMPSSALFQYHANKLNLKTDDPIVVYDSKGIFSGPRCWYMLKCFGATDVAVLQGGLPNWKNKKLPLETLPPSSEFSSSSSWEARDFVDQLVVTYDEILDNCKRPVFKVLDARSAGRFSGKEPEPREISSGHMPNSINLPFSDLLKQENGITFLKSEEELRAIFEHLGVDLQDTNTQIVTSCGSGVTACIISLALHLLGHQNYKLFDGSWSEYASRSQSIIVKD